MGPGLSFMLQTYGGGLWHTWFDGDLSDGGRVIVRDSDGSFLHKLAKIKRRLLQVPTLAIHLDRVREVCGKEDIDKAYQHFKAFYHSFSHVDSKLTIDY